MIALLLAIVGAAALLGALASLGSMASGWAWDVDGRLGRLFLSVIFLATVGGVALAQAVSMSS